MPDQIDTSIYAHQPIDTGATAFNAITNFANAQNAVVTAKSNMMQMRARQAMGPILQGAIGPDGNIDYNKASVAMAGNPDTAWMAPDFINQAIQRQYTQAETVKSNLANATTHYQAMGSAAASLLTKGNSVTSKDVWGPIADLIGSGVLDMPTAMKFMQHVHDVGDGAPLATLLQQTAATAQGAAKQIDTVNSGIVHNQTGGGITTTQNVPSAGINTQLGSTPMTPSPSQLGAPLPYLENGKQMTGPQGQIISQPSGQPGQYTPAGGAGPTDQNPITGPANGGGSGGGGNAPANGNPIMGAANGPQTPSQPGPNTPGGTNASQAPAPVGGTRNNAGGVQTGYAPQQAAVQAAEGTNWTTYRQGLNQTVETGRQTAQYLDESAKAATQFQLGPGTETRAKLAEAIQSMAGTLPGLDKATADKWSALVLRGDPKDPAVLGAAQEFEKLALGNALNWLRQSVGGQGRLTNLMEQKFTEAYPHLSTTPEGFMKINNMFKRIANITYAEQQAASRYEDLWKQNPDKFPLANFQSTWEKELVDRGIVSYAELKAGKLKGTAGEAPQ